MLFNRHGLQQKNWRMVKKGKHILFGCSLFFVVGGMSISGSQVVHASETNASSVVEEKVVANNTSSEISRGKASTLEKEQVSEDIADKKVEKTKQTQGLEKAAEKREVERSESNASTKNPVKKEVNKKELKDLVDKIKNTDIGGKTEKSVKELNLILSRAEKALDNKEITQEEIDKEVKALKEAFEKLEDKPEKEKVSQFKEKAESKKEEKSDSRKENSEKTQEDNKEDVARRHDEKITKATNIVKEIKSLASEINYEFSDSEKELVNTIEKLPTTDNNSEESIQKLLNEAIYLRNRVANRVTRANSGRRDPRNGKIIDKNGESGFRGVVYNHIENRRNGNLIENGSTAVYYNSDEIWSLISIKGERVGNERKFTTYVRGKVVEDVTPYYIVTVGFTGNSPIKGLKMYVAYWDKGAGVQKSREIEYGRTEINNPITNAAIRGVVGAGGIVQPGRYEVHIASNTRVAPNQLKPYTFTFIIKPQSERNTVKDLSQTYVDDVRHLTETEKTALIEKFKTEHPDVMIPSGHKSDFDHAEVSADGATMTIHFKDGFNPKTIQTNATNDVEAKHSSLTAYFGDSKELYTNPRELVRSKTGNEVPTTAQVTYKTPFNLQQVGTRNVVVTTTYENGVTKDVTTPYTVLDFIGKQDKKINQNQSGQLGDARNYITVSDNSALPGEFTVRWKGGSSTVDTSAAGVQHKEIEILRGNHLMKTITIPVEIVDNINPTITAPDSVLLTRLEGLPSEINISAQDNNKGVGLKDGNPITVENLPNPLFYNPKTSKIEINGVIPNNFQNGKSSIQVTVKAVDRKGNTTTKNITFNIQSQTQKYTAVANPKIQEVSHAQTPDPGTSISTTGLPANTQYKWERKPDTNTPGNKEGVVKVTYPDGSTDTVNVTVKVRKLSDEHEPTATKIVKNQNDSVSNNDLKAAVKINNNGNSKVRSVTPVGKISTTNAGAQTINATVTYLDGTTDSVSIPLEVKDTTAPTIQTPTDRQNWDLIALDRTLPPIKVTSVDNAGGTGIKSTTVTGLPDFLVYDNATKTIKFKNGVQEVTKLPVGQDSKIYNVNIQVTDNSNNASPRLVTITVKSMTTKYNATANSQKQTVSYGETPNAETSINKNGLPTGTTYTWRTIPNTTTGPGEKAGVVIVTYPDGSTDLVDVTVNVRKLSDEYEPTGTKIVKNQNDSVSNTDLKAAVTINNNGNSKVKSVTHVGNISTTNAGTQTISATVTYLDDTTDTVTIPLEVKDTTAPTIQTPTEGQLWEITSLDKMLPSIKVEASDNSGGSGVKSIVPINLPSFLKFDKATNSIVFQDGVREVPKLSGINRTTKTVTLRVEDNAGNSGERTFQIRQISMAEKYNPQANETIQEVSHGEIPNPKTSINTAGLPAGVQYTWKSTPDTTKPGDKTGVVTVTYPDDSIDEVTVTVKVRKLSDEYEPTATKIVKNQNDIVSNEELKAAVAISNNGASKVKSVTPVNEISTTEFGDKTINATVTYLDDTTDTVTIPLEVKDVTPPTIQAPTENTNWEMTALDKTLPNMEVRAEDNANGSGVKTVSVEGLPDYLEYDSATNSIKFKSGKQEVEKLPENTQSKEFNLNIHVEDNAGNVSERSIKITVSSMSAKNTPQPEDQTVNYGQVPNPEDSVNKQGLPDGTTVTWKTPPVVNTPGSTTGEVEITYPDGSKDVVTVNVTVRKVSEEFTATGTQIEVNQNEEVTSDMLKGAVNATNAQGENGNSKIAKVESKSPINTVAYGDQIVQAKVTYIDGSEQDVTIQLKVKDVTKPMIQTPTNGQNWDLIAVEGQDPNIAVTSEDNTGGSGVKSTTVTGLPDFLEYNESTKKIQFKEGVTSVPKLPEGTDIEPHNVTIKVVDNAGNETSTQVTITVKSMTTKYEATANSDKQTVSYSEEPNAERSVNKTNLPEGTSYTWKTTPDTNTPGEKDGVVEVTYKDGSKDTVNVKVNVNKLSDEYNVTATEIEVNQNTPVTNDDLKAKVTVTSKEGNVSGTDKIAKVEPKAQVSTAAYGETNIEATVTFKDGTTKDVTISLKVKDVTPPTIQTPAENTNWEMTALDKTLPNMEVRAEDNVNGSGVKTVSVEGLPDYLEYDSTTNSIKFKAGKQEVEKLSENTPSKEFNLNIRVGDNAGNVSERTAKITVSSMSEKKNPTPIAQNTSYGQVPDPNASIDKEGLPEGTNVTWKTPPVVTVPGATTGVVEVTYPDGSKDTVEVTVNVRKLSDEYNVEGTQIEVNQNDSVTNDDLKAKVTATSKVGNVNGTDKISSVEPKGQINTANYGEQTITATVTFKDGTTKEVTIPLKVKDVSPSTIQTPTNGQNWDLIAVEGTNPDISVTSEDNVGGSGVKTTTVTNLPDFLEYNESTRKIQFKEGVTSVPSLPEGTDKQPHNVTITVVDNAGNEVTTNVTITVKSMTTKYQATANPEKQTVSYGDTPDAEASIDKSGLPEGTTYTWATTPETNTPGEKDGVVEVTYKDGSKDIVNVKITVKELSSEYEVAGSQIEVNQNDPVSNDDLKAKVTATSKEGNINGTDKILTVEPKAQVSTAAYGETNIEATVTFKDGTTKDVTIPLKVKDVTPPTVQSPTNGQNWDLIAVEGTNPNISVISEDNTGGSGVKITTVTNLPNFLEYNESTKQIQFKAGVTSVPSLPEGTDVEPNNVTITVVDNAGNEVTTNITITVKSMTTKYEATENPEKQIVSYGDTPDAGRSVNKTDLPEGTSYIWKTKPETNTPGEKDGVVEVTYKDGSKDIVNVKITVKELSSEYEVAGSQIEVNQNDPVSNDDLKAKVTATSKVGNEDGTDKISKVEPKSEISTANYGDRNITATVTFKDGTTKEVTIPLKVKDVTPPTITAPTENTNWEMTALDKTLPNMEVRTEDNANGSGVKTVSVEGLPDYLEYDSTSNSIKFKTGKKEVEKLPENTPSKEFNLNIRVEDNAGNVSERAAKITISSISAKTSPQPNDQTVNYGQVPNPEDSVNKQGLPDGTTVIWKTPPVVNTPGSTTGEVEITYPDGSKDVVTVNVTVRKVSEEFTATGTQIEVNQNEEVTSDMLKGAVNATNEQGENGNAKIAKVESKSPINTATYGDQTIQAKVTYIDGSEQGVTIPLKVKDVTNPTIQTPAENTNWEITSLDKTLPVMKIEAEDNANGSGIDTIEVNNMPSFLTFDKSTGTIVFKEGVQEAPKIESDSIMYGVTIIARDKAGNSTSKLVNITVWSMRGKYNPQPKPQTVDNGTVPNAEASVDKTGLPEGTRVTWKETPVVNTPGDHPTVALVTYPDGTVDEVEVPITVKKQSDTYTPTAKQPNQTAKHGSDPSAEGSINTENLPKGTTYKWVEKPDTNTTPGSKTGKVLITYPDNSTEEVTVTVEVTPQNDDYNPQPKPQTVDNGTVPNAEASVDKTGLPEGTRVTWKETPVVNTPGDHPTVALVTYPDGTVDEVEVPITVKKQSDTFTPTAKQPGQTAKHGSEPSAEGSINTDNLPKGTTYTWVEKPDTNTTPGNKPGKVLITYPDNSTEEVTVTVEVTPQKDDYNPQSKPQTVDNGTVPNAEASVDKTGLPEGTRVTWKTNPDVSTPGSHPTVALVTYPDGTVDEVTVPITVKKQSDTFTPTAKQPGQTAKHGSEPSAEGSINTEGLPKGTTYKWVEKPDTNTTPGSKTGKVLITYPDNSTEEVTVTVEVTPQKDDYNPQPKAQTVDNGTVPNAEASVDKTGLPEGTRVTWKTNPDVSTLGSHPTVALVTYPDGTVDEVTVPITVKKQSDTYTPTAKQPNQTAKHGSDPSAEGSINTNGLPSGTMYKWVEKPDTKTTPGSKTGKVLITYPDNSTEEVTVTVEVTPQNDDYNPQPKPQTVDNGTVPNAEASVDKTGLPEGTRVTWKETPVVNTPGSHPTVALVTYPDGTVDEVEVPITVKKQSDTFTPTAKQPGQTAKHGSDPSAEGSINTDNLPKGTTYTWVEKPDTDTTPGNKSGKVLITYPDNSTEEVTVTVEVTPQKDDYNPQPKPQTVDNGTVPNAEDSVDKTGLPEGTTVTWKTNPDVSTPGSHPTVALVTYPDGTIDEVTVPITVKKQSDTFTPTAKQPGQTAKHGSDPSAEGSINTDGLPSGTTYKWVEKPDTNTTPGSKPGKVLITYPDNSTEEVTVTVEVTPQKDDYDPQPKPQTITNGDIPNAKDSIGNVNELPDGTKIEWKDQLVPSTNIPGNVTAKITITYPDGTEDEVKVTIIVNKQTAKGDPEVQPTLPEFSGGVNGDPEVQPTLPEFSGGVNGDPEEQPTLPEFSGGVNGDPEEQPALPEFSGGVNGEPEVQPTLPEFSGGVNRDPEVQPVLPEFNGGVNGDPEVQSALPEFSGGANGDPEVQPTLPEFNGGANGDPEVQPVLPEFNGGVNGDPEVQPALPEFSGGVNGDPEIQSELPKYLGRVNNDSEIRSNFRDKTSNVVTKRLANTGQSQNNSELAGLGLAIVGLFAAIKRRKNEEE